MKRSVRYTLAAALVMAVLVGISACGTTKVEVQFGSAADLLADDGRSSLVSSPSAVVRVGILPAPEMAEVSDYIAVQKSTLQSYAARTPDLLVAAVITFNHGVDQATLDQVVSLAGLELTSIEWQGPDGMSGVSSVHVDPDLAAIEKHIGSGDVSARGPVLAVAANGLAALKNLVKAASHPDVLLVDPGPLASVDSDARRGVSTLSQAPRSFYWRYQEAAAKQ